MSDSPDHEKRLAWSSRLIELSFEPILVWERDGGILEWNRGCERLYGYTRAEAVGRKSHDLLHTQFAEPLQEIERSLESQGTWTGLLRHTARNGQEVRVESRWQLMQIGGQDLVLETNRDVTERERALTAQRAAEEALRQSEARLRADAERLELLTRQLQDADRRKDEFLATLAHELRNPLAPIRYSATILKSGASAATVEKARGVIERQAAHLARLLDDLLDMSRITRNAISLKQEALDLRRSAQEAADLARHAMEARGHRVTISMPPQSVWIRADAERVLQIVGNLLSNSIKYTEPGGEIILTVKVDETWAELSVRDTGVGFPPEMAPRLFELFSQVKHTLNMAEGGLGIGLAVVQQLIRLHGGAIEAHSEGLGKGASFVVRLPLCSAPLGDTTGAGEVVPLFRPDLRVLIVEDNVDAADSLSTLLRAHGLSVQVARTARSALELAEASRPRVILLDIGLPDMSGYEFARNLRRRQWAAATRIIAVSGWTQDHDRDRSREAGIDWHLAKPAEPEALLALIQSIQRADGPAREVDGLY